MLLVSTQNSIAEYSEMRMTFACSILLRSFPAHRSNFNSFQPLENPQILHLFLELVPEILVIDDLHEKRLATVEGADNHRIFGVNFELHPLFALENFFSFPKSEKKEKNANILFRQLKILFIQIF